MMELDPKKIKPILERERFLIDMNRANLTDGKRTMAKILYSLVGLKPALAFVKYCKTTHEEGEGKPCPYRWKP